MWRKGSPRAPLVAMYIDAATMEDSMEISQKVKNRITIQFINSTPGYFPKECKNTNSKRYELVHYVHCNIIHNSQDIEAT